MKKPSRKNAKGLYAARRRRILSKIKGEAALFCTAPVVTLSRDQLYPYRPNSDFYYLTGLSEPEAVLLLLGSSKGPRSVLFVSEKDPAKDRWQDGNMGVTAAKRRFHVDEVHPISALEQQVPNLISSASALHYAPGSHPRIDDYVWKLFSTTAGPRAVGPHSIIDSRLLTSEMRVVKGRDEIRSIRHSCDLTAESFKRLASMLPTAKSELHAAKLLETSFAALGGDGIAFDTIVASGKNATVLHHQPTFQPLWRRSLVLIDAGAMFDGYAADMTRVFPVSGKFSEAQASAYDVVHGALLAATEKAQPGVTLAEIHRVAVTTLTKGLVALGVLSGKVPTLISEKAYAPYFMHRTSHWLGLDVHDISPRYLDDCEISGMQRPLEAGNVITLEPGLYFDAKDDNVPEELRGCGIRLEDSVLITASGRDVLTSRMPSAREEIEKLVEAK